MTLIKGNGRMNVLKHIILIAFIASCVRSPEQLNELDTNNSNSFRFKNFVKNVGLNEVVKDLPNYINLKRTFNLIMIGKLNESDYLGAEISVKETLSNKIIYNGQVLGLYYLPSSRLSIPISAEVKKVEVKLTRSVDDIRTKLFKIDERNVLYLEVEKM